MAIRELFDVSPVPFSISTIDHNARYVQVNPAYLAMIGRTWSEIEGQSLGVDLPYSIDDPARLARLNLLDTRGGYELAEIEMLHADGRIIPTLITAQRRRIGGESLDIEMVFDNSKRKVFEQEIMNAASVDSLTGLKNRAAFEKFLTQALTSSPVGYRIFLAFIDLNRFKRVNDDHGHFVGDRLLKILAGRLADWSNRDDFVARLGGDEFAVVSCKPAAELTTVGRYYDLAGKIAELAFIEGTSLQVGAAIGVAEAMVDETFGQLLERADRLMYAAKSSGQLIDVRFMSASPAPLFGGSGRTETGAFARRR